MNTYLVNPGVDWVNGQRVAGKTVRLTEAEARFDLDHGRISLMQPKRKKPETESDADE